ncbi:MAG: glycosyltransferase [Schleiferilactobacillus perolens]|uniref:glycosyltransferase n=1 Tax=Schleiferilactobacillus perolens TaxID=100468 RepID=UPI0039E738B2
MNYFVTNTVGEQSSGIEHSEMKRLNLFLDHGVPAKVVTTNYYSRFHRNFAENGLSDETSLNMFDYFLGNLSVPIQENPAKAWLAKQDGEITDLGEETDNDKIKIHGWKVVNGNQQMLIREDVNDGQISSIVYGTIDNRVIHSEIYDDRGFLSQDNIMTSDGKLKEQHFFSHTGEEIINWRLKSSGVTQSIFLKYKDEQRIFMNNDGLKTFFLDEINTEAGGDSLIISDRYENTPALAKMTTPARRYVYIHNVHVSDPSNLNDPNLNYNYQYVLTNPRKFSGIIALTEHQKADIQNRFGKDINIVVIPGGTTTTPTPISIASRPRQHHLLAVARISPEKRLDLAVQVAAKVKEEIPDVILDVYGFVTDQRSGIVLNNTVKQLDMIGSVHFFQYTHDIQKVYDESVLAISTSRSEGLPLTMLEAESNGLPIMAFDIHYGPNEIINNGESGYLFKDGDVDSMAAEIIKIFKDPFLHQKLSNGAYEAAKKFSPENVWKQWLQIAKIDKKEPASK